MKPFSPLKPLIAAMFVLAAASASAAPSSVEATGTFDGSMAMFAQSFSVTGPSVLNSWTFYGTQLENTYFLFDVLDSSFSSITEGAGFAGTWSAANGGSWSFADISTPLSSGSYLATLSFSGEYGTVSMKTGVYTAPAYLITDATLETESGEISGSYQYSASMTPVTAVPEPESYAMLLAGLGLMGAIARRRSRKA